MKLMNNNFIFQINNDILNRKTLFFRDEKNIIPSFKLKHSLLHKKGFHALFSMVDRLIEYLKSEFGNCFCLNMLGRLKDLIAIRNNLEEYRFAMQELYEKSNNFFCNLKEIKIRLVKNDCSYIEILPIYQSFNNYQYCSSIYILSKRLSYNEVYYKFIYMASKFQSQNKI